MLAGPGQGDGKGVTRVVDWLSRFQLARHNALVLAGGQGRDTSGWVSSTAAAQASPSPLKVGKVESQ